MGTGICLTQGFNNISSRVESLDHLKNEKIRTLMSVQRRVVLWCIVFGLASGCRDGLSFLVVRFRVPGNLFRAQWGRAYRAVHFQLSLGTSFYLSENQRKRLSPGLRRLRHSR